MKNRLGRKEWIDAGLKALSEQGIDSVRVERLAAALGVTKGSFYWHFKNRNVLLSALLEEWQTRATNDVITQVEKRGGSARTRLHTLFTIAMEADGHLDMAIRAWATKDSTAQTALSTIDKRRFSYLVALFTELGFSNDQATARARLVYNAHVGQFALGVSAQTQKSQLDELDHIFEMLVAKASN